MNCKKFLKDAGYKIMSKKQIDKVNVTEIIKEAEVSKQTFYRYYRDKYELANDIFYDLFVEQYYDVEKIQTESSWEEVYLRQFHAFKEHLDFTKNVYSSHEAGCTAEYDGQLCMELDKKLIKQRGGDITDPVILFALEIKNMGGVGYVRRWLMNDMQISCEEMIRRFELTMPSILTPYFD